MDQINDTDTSMDTADESRASGFFDYDSLPGGATEAGEDDITDAEIDEATTGQDGTEADGDATGFAVDDAMADDFRDFSLDIGLSEEQFDQLLDRYSETMGDKYASAMESIEIAQQRAVQDFREATGDEFDAHLERIGQARAHLAEELGLSYTDESGATCSKLDDVLELRLADGRAVGDLAPVLQLLSWVGQQVKADGADKPKAKQQKAKSFFAYQGEQQREERSRQQTQRERKGKDFFSYTSM